MNQFERELTENILPFWMNKMQDHEYGGFYGRIDGNDVVYSCANKGAILNARILWTFSSAYRLLKTPEYLSVAQRAFEYIITHFLDKEYGGVYWELDFQGIPVNRKKQVYAQGFALYGLTEFFRATGNQKALELAKEFFRLIEKCYDAEQGGYFEAYTEAWKPIADMRLSEKDDNEKKTMNTHLHILEPYTNLCRVWDNEQLKDAQKRLIGTFTEHILNGNTHHLHLFFDENWAVKSTVISYGHDIEASWLLFEAAEVLGDRILLDEIRKCSLQIVDAASEGLGKDGSMGYERKGNQMEAERHWWVQAETVLGYMYAYRNSANPDYREKALRTWEYIQKQMIDSVNGEWYWSRLPDGEINREDDKAGFWKCPYHNGRMCLEMMEHFEFID